MGDMADATLDDVMDEEDSRFAYRVGEISDADAYELGIVDELGFYNHPSMFGFKSRTKACRHCGRVGLRWKETDSGWRLATPDGNLHACPQYSEDKKT